MRIAIVAEVFLPKIDGVVGRTLNLIRHLVAAGDEVLIVCPEAEGCTQCAVPVLPVPSFPRFRPILNIASAFPIAAWRTSSRISRPTSSTTSIPLRLASAATTSCGAHSVPGTPDRVFLPHSLRRIRQALYRGPQAALPRLVSVAFTRAIITIGPIST